MRIRDAYRDGSVLVTGGTGFLGKVLIEKLLRTCVDVRWVVVLIRGKRGVKSEERLERMKASPVFDRLRSDPGVVLDKLIHVTGDIGCEPNMGLSVEDDQWLANEITHVFHAAATIRFDSSFEATASLNILGTKRLFDLCLRMRKLQVSESPFFSDRFGFEIDLRGFQPLYVECGLCFNRIFRISSTRG